MLAPVFYDFFSKIPRVFCIFLTIFSEKPGYFRKKGGKYKGVIDPMRFAVFL
jgi:hypothetical protein